jgi:hypothetical protein
MHMKNLFRFKDETNVPTAPTIFTFKNPYWSSVPVSKIFTQIYFPRRGYTKTTVKTISEG